MNQKEEQKHKQINEKRTTSRRSFLSAMAVFSGTLVAGSHVAANLISGLPDTYQPPQREGLIPLTCTNPGETVPGARCEPTGLVPGPGQCGPQGNQQLPGVCNPHGTGEMDPSIAWKLQTSNNV